MKRILFTLLGKDPEAIVVSYWTGPTHLATAMVTEALQLLPDRHHVVVSVSQPSPIKNVTNIVLQPKKDLYLQLRRALRGYRTGMAPVLFTNDPTYAPLRTAAFAHSPTKILAYNANLERHHLQLNSPIASLLFWKGVPLDRIWLRPKLWPGRKEQTSYPDTIRVLEGRRPSPARAKAAILTPFFPYPLSHGGAVRMYNLLKEASLTFDLSLFSFIEKESGEDLAPMLDFCEKLILVEKPRYREPRWASLDPPEVCEYRSPAMARAIAQSKPPVLEVEYTQLASYPAEILVEHDLTFDLYRQVYLQKQTFSAWWDWQRWLRFERRALRRVKRVVVMSEKDRQLSGCPHATVIPNGVDLSRYMPTPEPDTRRVLFIGSFRHFPNVLAFKFLIEQVWERIPNAELTVVAGPNPELHYSRMDSLPGNVRMLDFVADVRPLYEESNIAVVPTLVSAGTNIKVMEAMAMQRAVVSTFSGCDGLGLTHGESIWIADGPENFAQGLIELLNDAPRRKAIAAAGRRHAEEHFSWKQLGELQRQLLSEFAEPPLQVRAAVAEDTNGIAGIQSSSLKFLNDKSFVATFNGKIAGFLAMRQTAPGESEILDVIVAPENRRQGVGTRLVAEALKHCDGAMFLEVRRSNEAAKVLYEKLGFREVGIRQEYYTDPPEAALVLRFRL